MTELQDAIDRFALALPLLDEPGEGAAQYRDDAQTLVDAARRVANLDMKAAKDVGVSYFWLNSFTKLDERIVPFVETAIEHAVNAALGITTEDDK